VAAHLPELGGDERLAVAGDSAGGNLSAVIAQVFRDEGLPLTGQLLI
jgi:acetyl esterase